MTITAVPDPDFTLYKGEQTLVQITVYDQDGNVKDLTGGSCVIRFGDVRAGTSFYEKAGTLLDPSNGVIQFTITVADSAAASFTVKAHDYQAIVTDSGSDVQVVREGRVDIKYLLPFP